MKESGGPRFQKWAAQLGQKNSESYLNRPSLIDPKKTNAEMLGQQIILDLIKGRDINKPYRFNPLKNAFRNGMITKFKEIAEREGLTVEQVIEMIGSGLMNEKS